MNETNARGAAWTWWLCGLLLLATMLNYMDRQTLSLTVLDINKEFGKDARLYGLTDSMFGIAFACGALLVGLMVDRWSVRWIYPAAVLLWSTAGFLTGMVHGWFGLIACRFFLGLTEAGHWPCALRTTQHVLPPARRTLGNSILQSGAAVGAIITPLIVLLLVRQPSDWRYPFWVIGTLGIIWVVLWLVTVRKNDLIMHERGGSYRGDNASSPQGADATPLAPEREAPWSFLTDRRFVVLVVVVLSINMPWHYFRHWLMLVLENQNYSKSESLYFSSAYYVAADAGSLFVGFATFYLARRGLTVHGSRMVLFTFCTVLTMLGLVVALLPPGPLFLALLLLVAFGSLGLFPNYYSFSQELTVRHQGKLTGTLGFINWMAVAAMQAAVGYLVAWTGSHKVGVLLASCTPLVGWLALVFFWRDCQRAAKDSTRIDTDETDGRG